MNAMKGTFNPQIEDPSMYMMDMDLDMDDAVAIMTAMGESEGPQVKVIDSDFFNGNHTTRSPPFSAFSFLTPVCLSEFGDDFDDDDLD